MQSSFPGTERRSVDSTAVFALVLSIVGLLTCGLPFSLISLILSIVQTKKQNSGLIDASARARSLNKAAFVISIVGLVWSLIGAVFYMYMISTGKG